MAAYPLGTLGAMVLAVLIDVFVLRTRLVATGAFWVSLALMWFFQIFVDGWLTRSRGTIVRYAPEHLSGLRVGFNTPIEDFGVAFALILLTLSVWHAMGRSRQPVHREQG